MNACTFSGAASAGNLPGAFQVWYHCRVTAARTVGASPNRDQGERSSGTLRKYWRLAFFSRSKFDGWDAHMLGAAPAPGWNTWTWAAGSAGKAVTAPSCGSFRTARRWGAALA